MIFTFDIATEECFVADGVDQSWDTTGVAKHSSQCTAVEGGPTVGSGDPQSVGDVHFSLGVIEGSQVVADGDPLAQLTQAGLIEHLSKLGLPHQHDLQELLAVGL